MFRPNLTCLVERTTGATSVGKRLYSSPLATPCAIVFLTQLSQPTSVRTDSSGSHAGAMDDVTMSRLLFPGTIIPLKAGDKITVQGFALTVASIFPQHAVTGRFDHWQVDCTIWKG